VAVFVTTLIAALGDFVITPHKKISLQTNYL